MVRKLFYPREIVPDLFLIDTRALRERGIKGLILDIDDTLIPREVKEVSPKVFAWIQTRKEEGFKICLTSNSRHPIRVKYFGDTLGVPSMHFSLKPLPFAFWRSLEILGTKAEETAMIGDQLFMDIWGANWTNIYSIYIDHRKEEWFPPRRWMRWAERWLIDNWR